MGSRSDISNNEGDIVEIDIPSGRLHVEVSDEELAERKKSLESAR